MGKSASQKVSDYRRRRKKALVLISGGRCNLCGYNKSIAALQFHHINPEDKTYGLAQKGTCHKLESDLEELKKCILVCANCHREIHQGFYSKQQLINYKIYDQTIANEIIQDNLRKRFKEKRFCINCGKELSSDTKGDYCASCKGLARRKVQQRPTRDELKYLIRNKSFLQLGRDFNITDNAIRKWCDSYSLPRTKKEINSFSEEQWQKI